VPAQEPWEIPAVIGYGGWNDYPDPDDHDVTVDLHRLLEPVRAHPQARSSSLIDPDIVHLKSLWERRGGIRASGPRTPDGNVQHQVEMMVEHPP
jgi:hypothetical protein